MQVRHIIFAGLFAATALANAGTVPASTAAVQPAWSAMPGAGSTAAAPTSAFGSLLAGPGNWSSHTRRGDRSAESTMLFSQASVGAAHAAAPALAAAPVFAAMPGSISAPEAAPEAAPEVAAEVVIAAPAPGEMPAIVVSADVIAAAPVALAAIPEPATGMLMLAGLLGAGFMSRRRK